MGFFSYVNSLDYWVSQQVMQFHNIVSDRLFLGITTLGDPTAVIVLAILLVIFWVIKKRYNALLLMLAALLGSFLSVSLIKILIQRPRPEIESLIQATGYSFPSAHATVSMAFCGILAYLIGQSLQDSGWKEWKERINIVAGVLIFAIGFSRIYWGVHYLSDVVCGWILGACWLWITIHWIAQKIPKDYL